MNHIGHKWLATPQQRKVVAATINMTNDRALQCGQTKDVGDDVGFNGEQVKIARYKCGYERVTPLHY